MKHHPLELVIRQRKVSVAEVNLPQPRAASVTDIVQVPENPPGYETVTVQDRGDGNVQPGGDDQTVKSVL